MPISPDDPTTPATDAAAPSPASTGSGESPRPASTDAAGTASLTIRVSVGNGASAVVAVDVADSGSTTAAAGASEPGAAAAGATEGDALGLSMVQMFAGGRAAEGVTFALDDDAGGRFRIDAETGRISRIDGGDVDPLGFQVRSMTFDAGAAGDAGDGRSFRFTAARSLGATPTGPDDAEAAGETVLGTATFGSGVQGGVVYSLADDAGGRVRIDPATGVVRVVDGSGMPLEILPQQSVTLAAAAADGAASSAPVEFRILGGPATDAAGAGAAGGVAAGIEQPATPGAAGGAGVTDRVIIVRATAADGSSAHWACTVRFVAGGEAGPAPLSTPLIDTEPLPDLSSGMAPAAVSAAQAPDDQGANTPVFVLGDATDGIVSEAGMTVSGSGGRADASAAGDSAAARSSSGGDDGSSGAAGIGPDATAGSDATAAFTGGATADTSGTPATPGAGGAERDRSDAAPQSDVAALDGATDVDQTGSLDETPVADGPNDADEAATPAAPASTPAEAGTGDPIAVDAFDVGAVGDADATADRVTENAAAGTAVGITAFAVDGDATASAVTYSLDDDAGGRFAIDAATGVVTVADGAVLDAEAAPGHTITVRATSEDGSSSTRSFAITVGDANEAPVAAAGVAILPHNSSVTWRLGASDADAGDTLTFSLESGAAHGTVTVSADGTYTYTPTSGHVGPDSFTFRVTDSGGLSSTASIAIDVTTASGSGTVTGGAGLDALVGGSGNDVITGHGGDDLLRGGGGADILDGGSGDDALHYSADATWGGGWGARDAGSGPDMPGSNEFRSIAGMNRTHDVYRGGDGHDVLYGTSGNDALFLHDSYSPNGGDARIVGIERMEMGDGNDVVDLTSDRYTYGDVSISGGGGSDVLWGSAGNDTLSGDSGNDQLRGGYGDDVLDGGTGNDTLFGGVGNDTLTGGEGNDVLHGDAGNDLFTFASGDGSDTVHGGLGGGWTDIIRLDGVTGGPGGGDWTLQITSGSIVETQADHLVLSGDAAGTITLADGGGTIAFDGLERVQW